MGAARAFHGGKDQLIAEKAGNSCEPPAVKVIYVTCYWPVPLAAA
jgi:hypothetical protein